MIRKKTVYILTGALFSLAACGDDKGVYENEVLSFENLDDPQVVAAKTADSENEQLVLQEQERSDFGFRPLYSYAYPTYMLHEYYKRPLTVNVSFSPYLSDVDYIHPFYVPYFIRNLYDQDDDDDHGRSHRRNRRHR